VSNRIAMAVLAAGIAVDLWILRQMRKREDDWVDAAMWRASKAGSRDE